MLIKSFVNNQPKTHTACSITNFSLLLYSYPGNKEQTAALEEKESSLNTKASSSGSACLIFEFDFEFVTNSKSYTRINIRFFCQNVQ